MGICLKIFPINPGTKKSGKKVIILVNTENVTGIKISRAPRTEA